MPTQMLHKVTSNLFHAPSPIILYYLILLLFLYAFEMIILLYFTFLTLNPKIEVVFDLIFFCSLVYFQGQVQCQGTEKILSYICLMNK
jgi:hypothetical protein